jgi:hypothetical protein
MKRLITVLSFALLAIPAIAMADGSESKESVWAQQYDFIAPAQ